MSPCKPTMQTGLLQHCLLGMHDMHCACRQSAAHIYATQSQRTGSLRQPPAIKRRSSIRITDRTYLLLVPLKQGNKNLRAGLEPFAYDTVIDAPQRGGQEGAESRCDLQHQGRIDQRHMSWRSAAHSHAELNRQVRKRSDLSSGCCNMLGLSTRLTYGKPQSHLNHGLSHGL